MESIRISWSSLRTWRECKQKAQLTRTGRRLKVADKRVFLPGTVSDRVVRDWLANPEPGLMPQMVSEYLDKSVAEEKYIKWKHPGDRAAVEAEVIEAVTKIEPALLQYVVPFENWPDFKFEAPMHAARNGGGEPIHVTLNGFMDILVRDNRDRWFVFDVKHTRDSTYWKKTGGQMVFYTGAVELLKGVPATGAALLQPLASPKIKPIETGDAARLELFQDITRMANDIVNDEMPPRDDTKFCGWCDVKHACVKFKTQKDASGRRKTSLLGPAGLD